MITALIIVAFWMAYYAATTFYSYTMPARSVPASALLLPRAIVSALGIPICLVFAGILSRLRGERLAPRALVALGLTFVGAIVHSLIGPAIFGPYIPDAGYSHITFFDYVSDVGSRIWFFATICGILVALSYVADIEEREERIGALQVLAHSAQLRALRYQLNPHFLFNALNSVAGLISSGQSEKAERMTENLADFLRTTLALDPQAFVTLEEEARLQGLYLEIEKVRFPDRLRVVTDIPDELRSCRIPALITQPLIENSIKYAVAKSSEPVEIRITARERDGVIVLVIEDDGGDAEVVPSKGSHLGLGNVTERLHASFGEEGRLIARKSGSGFLNQIIFPAERVQ
jgi:hypothetical protein